MNSERRPRIPKWAERERASDLAWIGENLHVLWPAAQLGHENMGRGAVVVDATTVVAHEEGSGNPVYYVPEAEIERTYIQDALRLVRAYDPTWEFVTGLLKCDDKESFYRIGLPHLKPPTT